MRGKRILVTGDAGFIGSHLCEPLLAEGQEAVSADNYFTGRRGNIAHLLDNPRFEALRHDVTFPLYIEVDEIYNLACPASPVYCQIDPVHTTKTSVVGAINMLGLAKRLTAKVFQASTSEVYGDPTVHPQDESYRSNVNPIRPRACYDEGKRCAETLFVDYHRQHRTRIKVMCIFNTYGRACTRTTVAWCRTSSPRRCRAATSPSTPVATRPGPSATSTTSSTASCG